MEEKRKILSESLFIKVSQFYMLYLFCYFPMMESYNMNNTEDYILVLSTLNILVKELSQKTRILSKKILVISISKS
jgi:hypothetical protein